jgi:hypothetical protein
MKMSSAVLAAVLAASVAATLNAQVKERPLPCLVKQDGCYALFVDDAPYLMLGAQAHNSSGWPAMLPKVWPAMEYLNVNTVEIPVYWEQFEPRQGQYDHSVIDALLSGRASIIFASCCCGSAPGRMAASTTCRNG